MVSSSSAVSPKGGFPMSDETSAADAAEAEAEAGASGRQRSKVAFPYTDLNSAVAVAAAIHDKVGNGDCSLQQLSAWLDQSIKSSGFRVQLAAARLFGVIESEGTENYRLTPLGRRIVDPEGARKGKADAFLNVPLFRSLFNNHQEGVLPPAAALEREIATLGVAEKQKDRARQVFERSADQAGFFEHGKNRLVMPAIAVKPGGSQKKDDDVRGGGGKGGSSGDGGHPEIDPIIRGLLARLPKTGDVWPEEARALWLELLKGSFKLIYRDSSNEGTAS
jgi:hypothetical protein